MPVKVAKKKSSAPRRKAVTRKPKMGGVRGQMRSFTELAQLSDLIVSDTSTGNVAGQTWAVAINSVPQLANYKALYNEYKITKLKFTFVPSFNTSDQNQQQYNSGAGGTYSGLPVMTYAIQRDASSVAPLNELEVLTQNGCRLTQLRKPITITVTKPQPEIYVQTSGGGTTAWEQTGWLDLNSSPAAHFGIQTFLTDKASNLAPGYSVARVYCQIFFSLRSSK